MVLLSNAAAYSILPISDGGLMGNQLNAYVAYYKKNEMVEGDNPPVGICILLCTDKGSQMVEYALSGMDNQLFVSTYMLHLPDKTQLEEFMRKELEELEGDM